MFQHNRLDSELTFVQKVKNLDYILLFSIILLSIISFLLCIPLMVVNSLSYKKSFYKLLIFFPLMIIISFFNIKFWHTTSYLFILLLFCF